MYSPNKLATRERLVAVIFSQIIRPPVEHAVIIFRIIFLALGPGLLTPVACVAYASRYYFANNAHKIISSWSAPLYA